MKDLLLVTGFLIFWITLNRWILPWFGIQTCMSGACCSIPATRTWPVDTSEPDDRLVSRPYDATNDSTNAAESDAESDLQTSTRRR